MALRIDCLSIGIPAGNDVRVGASTRRAIPIEEFRNLISTRNEQLESEVVDSLLLSVPASVPQNDAA